MRKCTNIPVLLKCLGIKHSLLCVIRNSFVYLEEWHSKHTVCIKTCALTDTKSFLKPKLGGVFMARFNLNNIWAHFPEYKFKPVCP